MRSEQDERAGELLEQLLERIEASDVSLHTSRPYQERCRRVQAGLKFSQPGDCTCGLEDLLRQARLLVRESRK
jgi:hypothetical protein